MDLENCVFNGSNNKMTRSFSLLMNRLMEKERLEGKEVGLVRLNRWSGLAADMLAATTDSSIKHLRNHPFLEKSCKEDLKFLVTFVSIAARIDYRIL